MSVDTNKSCCAASRPLLKESPSNRLEISNELKVPSRSGMVHLSGGAFLMEQTVKMAF